MHSVSGEYDSDPTTLAESIREQTGKLFFTVEEAAELLGFHRNTIYGAIKKGVLKGYRPKLTRNYRIQAEALAEWVTDRSSA